MFQYIPIADVGPLKKKLPLLALNNMFFSWGHIHVIMYKKMMTS